MVVEEKEIRIKENVAVRSVVEVKSTEAVKIGVAKSNAKFNYYNFNRNRKKIEVINHCIN
jgi:hypothetical protein